MGKQARLKKASRDALDQAIKDPELRAIVRRSMRNVPTPTVIVTDQATFVGKPVPVASLTPWSRFRVFARRKWAGFRFWSAVTFLKLKWWGHGQVKTRK